MDALFSQLHIDIWATGEYPIEWRTLRIRDGWRSKVLCYWWTIVHKISYMMIFYESEVDLEIRAL